jgi:hypothetical protein
VHAGPCRRSMFFHALLFVLHHYGGNAHSGAAFLDTEKVPFTAGENEEGQVTKKYGFWIVGAALIILNGCGSTGGSSYTGSIYETNPPLDVSTIAGTAGVFGSADGTGPTAQFGQPDGVVLSPDGTTLYVADFGNSTIRKMDLSTGAVRQRRRHRDSGWDRPCREVQRPCLHHDGWQPPFCGGCVQQLHPPDRH